MSFCYDNLYFELICIFATLQLKDPEHAVHGGLERLLHGHRFRSLARKTNRRGNSFVPTAVRLLSRA